MDPKITDSLCNFLDTMTNYYSSTKQPSVQLFQSTGQVSVIEMNFLNFVYKLFFRVLMSPSTSLLQNQRWLRRENEIHPLLHERGYNGGCRSQVNTLFLLILQEGLQIYLFPLHYVGLIVFAFFY